MSLKGLFRPAKRDMQQAAALISEALRRNFSAQGIDMAQYQKDLAEQTEQQLKDDVLKAQAREHHAQFLSDQHERYTRFQKLLNAMRAIYRDDPVMQSMLAEFRRARGRSRSHGAEPSPTPSSPPPSEGQPGARVTATA